MLFAVLFEDNDGLGVEVRQAHMQDHLTFLDSRASVIQAAGPFKTPDGDMAGGMWLVNAETFEEVDALVKEDPFWPTGLRKSVKIVAWSQVFAEGKRLI